MFEMLPAVRQLSVLEGKGTMAALGITCVAGGIVGVVAPLALAVARGTALLVDLDPSGPSYPGEGSLAQLVADGPRLADLRPGRRGVAVLRNGGVDAEAAEEVVDALVAGWPDVVLRLPAVGSSFSCPAVPVVPLLPGGLTPLLDRPAVYQQTGWNEKAPGPGVVIPTPSRSVVSCLLQGGVPAASRWIGRWRSVWEMPWA